LCPIDEATSLAIETGRHACAFAILDLIDLGLRAGARVAGIGKEADERIELEAGCVLTKISL
jgi:hypothetical protein